MTPCTDFESRIYMLKGKKSSGGNVVVFFQARSCIGAGTIINMIFVGYIADFICYVTNDVVQIQMNLPLHLGQVSGR